MMSCTNSALVSYTRISPNRTSPRNHAIDTITIHCVCGQCTVQGLGSVFAPATRKASSNYGIGADGKIGMYCEEKDRSWCSSSASNDNRAVTIEVASDVSAPYAVRDAAYASLLDLCVDICQRNGKRRMTWISDKAKALAYKPAEDEMRMTVHRWFADTSCPGAYLMGRMSDIAAIVTRRLQADLEDTKPSQITDTFGLSKEQFSKLLADYNQQYLDNDAASWSEEARAWAVETGLINGVGKLSDGSTNYAWGASVTREQLVTILYRYHMLGRRDQPPDGGEV